MGKKKHPSVSKVTKPQPSLTAATVDPASKLPTPAVESVAPDILREGLQTVEKLERGECIIALKMIRKSISSHGGSPHLRFIEALVNHRLAEKSAIDSRNKLMYLEKAMSSGKSAWEKLPNSLCFALLVIDIFYQKAIFKLEDWRLVVQQCEKALSIENPTDPGVDKFLEDVEMQNSSKKSRIEYAEKQIFTYLQVSNLFVSLKPRFMEVDKAMETENKVVIDSAKLKLRMREIEVIVGDWIVKKQRAINFRIKKVKGNAEKAKKYKDFWCSKLSAEKKEDLQKIHIQNLQNHFYSSYHYLVPDLREAISFAAVYGTWKYWECCTKKFGDRDTYRNHAGNIHGPDVDLEEKKVTREWIEIISKGEWKPMATDMARNFIVNQLKLESYDALESELSADSSSNVSKDKVGSISKEEGVQDLVGDKSDTNVSPRTYMDCQKWPACVDKNREKMLEKILEGIHLLLRNNCLAVTHLHWAILFAFEKFEIVIPQSQIFPGTLKFICFLEASHLDYIVRFFDQMGKTCGLTKNHKIGSYLDDYIRDDTVSDMKEMVRFSEDFSHLLVYENDVLLENEDFVSWLYEDLMTVEDLESLKNLRDSQREKSSLVGEICVVEKLHLSLINTHNEFADDREHLEGIMALERIYLEETKKMEKDQGHATYFFSTLLTEGHKDTKSHKNIAFIKKSKSISNILDEVKAATSSYQSKIQEGVPEDELGKQMEHLRVLDNRLALAMQTMKKRLTINLAFIDGLCMRCEAAFQKYDQLLDKLTLYDYMPTLVPLLRSYLQTNLENLFYNDAVEALLADVDAEESTKKGQDSVTRKQKSSKKKIFGLPEESKGTDGGKDSQLHQKEGEHDNLGPEIGASKSFDEVEESIPTDERLPEEFSEDHNKSKTEPTSKVNLLGVGVKHEVFDCFLNVITRSLWCLVEFREELMSRSKGCHKHLHDSDCTFCALKEKFAALSKASGDEEGEAVDLSLIKSLLLIQTSFFKREEILNAFDCVRIILEFLHESIVSILNPEDQYDCSVADCFVHRIFGWDHHERIYCGDCGLESGHQKTTSLFFILSAVNLRLMKEEDAHSDSSFDDLLKLVNGRMTCNQCGNWKDIYHSIRGLPPIFTMALVWPKQVESSEDISETLSALSAELNLSAIFQGRHPNSEYCLVSMVCSFGDQENFVCFNYDHELKQYVLYDDKIVEVTGSWEDVIDTCKTTRLQPNVLFFNQKSRMNFGLLQSQCDT